MIQNDPKCKVQLDEFEKAYQIVVEATKQGKKEKVNLDYFYFCLNFVAALKYKHSGMSKEKFLDLCSFQFDWKEEDFPTEMKIGIEV